MITPFFNQVINSTVNFCEFLNGTRNNPVINWLFKMAGESLPPDFIHACPYYGELKAPNVSFKITPEMAVFLLGRYMIGLRVFDVEDGNIFTAFVDLEMTADLPNRKKPIKTSSTDAT
jgi:Protein of unknown function (DUF1091)